jgi:heavy metal sensor kinase
LTLWYTAVVAVVLIAFSSISYALIAREIRTATDTSLADTAREFAAAVALDPSNAVSGNSVPLDFRYSDRDLVVFTPRGDVIASSRLHLTAAEQQRLAAAVRRAAVRRAAGGFLTLPGGTENDGIRVFVMPVRVIGQPFAIAVARSLHEQADRLEAVARSVFLGIPLALLLAAGGGYLLARNALRPVTAMSRQARQISAETLTARIPVENERDELGFLAVTLNDLLERLQRSFDMQRRFMADASHELRTPVSIIQGEADVTLARPDRSSDEYRESIEVMQKAALKLTRIVQNLFLLARTDAGQYPMQRCRFYLDELIADCVRSMRNIAAARGVTLEHTADTETVIEADEELVHRMLLNLIDNALKFTSAGGRVTVQATAGVIRVSDTGSGIPPEDQGRIFERFFRADRTTGGAGLGLPIARWIAEAHGGSLTLERSDAGGTTFKIELPA